ncbi:MAG TPA: hypothetical protein VG204_05815 [Terriglobia bacterium]|nr:hypothetical protein [Terriglobia bacterium]
MKNYAGRAVLGIACGTLALILLDVVVSRFRSTPGWRWALADLLTAAVLAYAVWAARESHVRTSGLVARLTLLYFGIGYFNTLDEGMLFIGLPGREVAGGLVFGLLRALVVVAVLVALMGPMGRMTPGPAAREVSPVPRSFGQWLWRLAIGDVAYVFLYFVAGMLVFPFVKEFYITKTLPAPSTVILMQLFRALVYMAVALPVARLMRDRRHAALALGLAFSVLGGIAPLLPENPLMPGYVRLAHSIEIGVSNFIYGVILAWLFVPASTAAVPAAAEHAT